METQKLPKNPQIYICNLCDVKCKHKGDWNKHLLTAKHQKLASGNNWKPEETKISPKKEQICCCGKVYSTKSGLWKHQKNCNENTENKNDKNDEITDKKIIIELLKSNKELKDMVFEQNKTMLELASKIGTTVNNNTTNNTNNFNLQFFLNEQCKDALNIMDFINQLKLNTTDLDMVGRVGYSEGISKLFIRGLKELDVFKRPIHCSDLKREVVYVKDKDAWEKDNDEKNKMKTAIKYIAAKNFRQIKEWKQDNPESDDYDSKKHMDYHQIVIHSMGGATKEEDEQHYNKIIRNVAKESVIDKSISK